MVRLRQRCRVGRTRSEPHEYRGDSAGSLRPTLQLTPNHTYLPTAAFWPALPAGSSTKGSFCGLEEAALSAALPAFLGGLVGRLGGGLGKG